MATIRVKMGHFAPGNAVNRATSDCFQPFPIIGQPRPITFVFAQGRNHRIKAHRRPLFPVPPEGRFLSTLSTHDTNCSATAGGAKAEGI